MLKSLKRTKIKAFSLIELIVVIVLLGILSGLSVPTFSNFLERSQIQADTASLQALARAASADAARNRATFDLDLVKGSILSVQGGESQWSFQGTSMSFGEVSASINPNGKSLQLATSSTSKKKCIFVDIETSATVAKGSVVNVAERTETGCTAVNAEAGASAPSISVETTLDYIRFYWEAVPEANTYEVRWRYLGDQEWNEQSRQSTLNFYPNPPKDGETYEVQVRSWNVNSSSEWSAVKEGTFRPAAPLNLSASVDASTNNMTLTWDASYGADSYQLFKDGVEVPDYEYLTINSAEVTLSDGSTSEFSLRAFNVGGPSPMSQAISVSAAPSTPEGFNAEVVNDNAAKLDWNETLGAESYNVYVNKELLTNVKHPGVTINIPMAVGETSGYAISALNKTGESARTEEIILSTSPGAPQALRALSNTAGEAVVSWDEGQGALGYGFSTTATVKSGSIAGFVPKEARSVTINGTPGATYSSTVESRGAPGTSRPAVNVSVILKPNAPTNLTAARRSANNTTAALTWVAPAGNWTGYQLRINGGAPISLAKSALSYTASANPGVANSYQLVAVSGTAVSEPVNASVITAANPVVTVYPNILETTGGIYWEEPIGTISYTATLTRGTATTGGFTNLNLTTDRYQNVNIQPGKTYTFTITARNASGANATTTHQIKTPPRPVTGTNARMTISRTPVRPGQTQPPPTAILDWDTREGSVKHVIENKNGVVKEFPAATTAFERRFAFTEAYPTPRRDDFIILYAVSPEGVKSSEVRITFDGLEFRFDT